MDYGYVITQGWSLVWRNRFIWILGFLAALVGGGVGLGGQLNFNISPPTSSAPTQELDPATSAELERAIRALESGDIEPFLAVLPLILGVSLPVIVGFMVISIVVWLLLWLVGLLARAGLIAAVDQSNQGLQPTFGSVIGSGGSVLLRVVGMKIILSLPSILLSILAILTIGGSIVALYQFLVTEDPTFLSIIGGGIPILLTVFCFAFFLGVFLQIIEASAYRGIVVQNMGVFRAIGHGFGLLFRRLLDILVLGLIFIAVGILVWAVLFGVFIPIQFLGALLFSLLGGGMGVYIGSLGWFTFSAVVIAFITALLVAWQSVTFSFAYLEFIGRNQQYGSYVPPGASPTIWKTP